MKHRVSRSLIVVWVLIPIIAIPLQGLPHDLQTLFRYERLGIEQGEFWRLFSGHLIHLSWAHLAMNLLGLAVIIALFYRQWTLLRFCLTSGVSLLVINAGFWWWVPGLSWYAGLSGVLHGLLIAGAGWAYASERAFALLVLAFVLAKLIWETLNGTLTSTWIGGTVITEAHMLGALGGLISLLMVKFIPLLKRSSES